MLARTRLLPAATLEAVQRAQARRDEGDRMRPVGALRPAADAVLVETDGLTRDEVVERLAALVRERVARAGATP